MNTRFLVVTALLCIAQLGQAALDPSAPPSDNFDLGTWKVTLPDQSEEDVADLVGFQSANEFYTDPVSGAMVFRCPNDGATGGSTYPRSELREMLRGTNTGPNTGGFTLNNWVFSTASQSHQDDTAGVDGTMTAIVTVDHVSTTGNSSMIGRVIIGQIHASGDEPCRLYYRKLPGNSKGSIYMAHEPTDATGLNEQWYEMIGSRSNSASNPADGIALGEEFSYKIEVVGSDLNVTIMRDGKPDVTQYVDMTSTGHLDDWMYFKAGCYNQNNSGNAGEYAQVSFYALSKAHTLPGNSSPAFTGDPINELVAYDGAAYNSTLADNASDPDSDAMTFSKLSGPAWLSVAADGTLSGTPGAGDVGANVFTVQVLATGGLKTTTLNITVDAAPAYAAPYDIPKFQAAIAECKLQAPDSSTRATQAQLIAGFNNSEFYVADTDKMAFYQTGDSMRSELRFLNNWYINAGDRSAHANVKIESQTCEQVTFLQIHDDNNGGGGVNKPLLRIYKHQTKSPANHIWAAIKTDAAGINTTHVDLGPAPAGYFDCDITISGGNMLIAVDGSTLVNTDVSFWTYPSYWKAGAYLQDAGDATIHFNELTWTEGINQAPAWNSNPVVEAGATENVAYSSTLAGDATDPEGDPLTFSKVGGPGWLSIAGNGDLTGTPAAGDVGLNTFDVQVDATGGSNLATLNITVNAASAGGTVLVVDDSFADGNRANTGALQADWWSSSSTGANSIEAYTGQLGLVTGTSGRGIHGTFTPQTLAIGDSLVATLTFTTPATVGSSKSGAFKIAIMDLNNSGLADDLSSSSGSVNPLYTSLPGYFIDLDVNTGSSADVGIREHDVPNSLGRFLGTSTEWTELGSGPNAGYTFSANTEYVVIVSVMKTGADSLDVTGSLSQGGSLLASHTESDASGTANNFGMLGIWANSNTFGSSNSQGSSEDNGITFSNIKVEYITPAPVNQPPSFSANPINEINATEDVAYTSSIADNASDPDGDTMTFTKVSGPSWLNVASNGALSGTPSNSDVGLKSWTVSVAAGAHPAVEATLEITVINSNDSPTFNADPINRANATEDSAYSGTISGSATDVDVGDSLTYSKVSGPAWLSVASNGALSGTPSNADVGGYSWQVGVSDGNGGSDTATLNITVANSNDDPTFTVDPINKSAATEDVAYSGTINGSATDVDVGDSLTYSKVSGPAWLSVASNGSLSGTPSNADADVGAQSWQVGVSDGNGGSDTATLNITVGAVVTGYDLFAQQYGIEGDGMHFDSDFDGQNNLGEYVFGGNPTNSSLMGYEPILNESMQYVYVLTDDALITYQVMMATNLVTGFNMTNSAYLGSDAFGSGMLIHSNSVDTTTAELFLRLELDYPE